MVHGQRRTGYNFGTNGLVDTQVGPRTANPGSFLLQPNGQSCWLALRVATARSLPIPTTSQIWSLLHDTTPMAADTTFGNDGVVLLNIASVFQGIEQIALLTSGDY